GIDAERQGVGQRVANDRARDQPVFADPGDTEQHQQVGGADQDQLAKAKARQHHVGSANKDIRAVTGGTTALTRWLIAALSMYLDPPVGWVRRTLPIAMNLQDPLRHNPPSAQRRHIVWWVTRRA